MRTALKSITTTALQVAAVVFVERLLPAIAAGLVAMAHELHPQSARAESIRRMGQ